MGKPTGFMEFDRELPKTKQPEERVKNYREFYQPFPEEKTQNQAARCMDCGVPFCHNGCPLGNNIPAFNDAVYAGDWELAYETLAETNNFPEFTGRICPAPCESSCVLGINQPPVSIEHIEKSIIEKAFELGLVQVPTPVNRSGKKVAVVGSGPAGLAAAAQLNEAGHTVTVFERDANPGGLLRYGIPDFKLEKWVIERRIDLMKGAGIVFQCNTAIGTDISMAELKSSFDAVVLCGGSTVPRNLPIEGRELKGVHFAMDFLSQQNKRVSNEWKTPAKDISAKGKHVVVIGGGDTGADCVGTSNRQGAASVTQIELMGQPPKERDSDNPWPNWPVILRTSSSHEEGCERKWSLLTKAFLGDEKGNIRAIQLVDIEWNTETRSFKEIEGTEREIPCDLALLAIGFAHPEHKITDSLSIELDSRKNVQTQEEGYHTSVEGIFAAGDMRRGQSLVVWAISEGREAAREVDEWLVGGSLLPARDRSHFEVV